MHAQKGVLGFENLPEYLAYVEKETGLKQDKFIVLSKEEYFAFGNDVVADKLYAFYGIVYNSNLVSASKLDIKSCVGQFLELCKNSDKVDSWINIESKPYLKNISFNKGKKTVIFVYSADDKKGFNKYIKSIIEEVKDDSNFDYLLISADTPSIKSLR